MWRELSPPMASWRSPTLRDQIETAGRFRRELDDEEADVLPFFLSHAVLEAGEA